MKLAPTYLTQNRHGTFYFRMVIPALLRPLVNGKREIRRSLKTDSERLALKRARQHAVHFDSIFGRALRMIEHDGYEPSQEDLDLYEELYGMPKSTGAGAWSDPIAPQANLEPILSDAEIEERQRRHYIVKLLTGRYDRPIPNEQEPLARQLLELSRPYQPTELPTALPKLRDKLVLRNLTPASEVAASRAAPDPNSRLRPEASQWTLYQVWEEELRQAHELKDTKRGGPAKNEGTRKDYDRKARCASILTNHKPVGMLTKEDWRQAYRNACKLKRGAEASVDPDRLTPVTQLIATDRDELAGTETINGQIIALKRQHEFARKNDLTLVNVDEIDYTQLKRRPDEEEEAAEPFTDEDLNKIFGGYTYKGELPARLRVVYPYHYWLPLIGYFTGARANELAQLDVVDFTQELADGKRGKSRELIWCINFREDPPGTPERKRIKTGENRVVPIHPVLLELGLLNYVEEQKKAGQKKLFGDGLSYAQPEQGAENNKEGWLKNASRHFNSIPSKGEKVKGYFYRVGVHTEAGDGKTLYSFRKTLTTALNDAIRDGSSSIAESTIQAIIGHAPTTMMGSHYDKGATPRQMKAALEQMPIPEEIHSLKGYQVDF